MPVAAAGSITKPAAGSGTSAARPGSPGSGSVRAGAHELVDAHHPVPAVQDGYLVAGFPAQPLGRPHPLLVSRAVAGLPRRRGQPAKVRAHVVAGVLGGWRTEIGMQFPAACFQFARHAERWPGREAHLGIGGARLPCLGVRQDRDRCLRHGHPDRLVPGNPITAIVHATTIVSSAAGKRGGLFRAPGQAR
jgi:hypothetical protein